MIAASDVTRMRSELFFEGDELRRKMSRFWILLVLAAIIASAGVGGDSTATVIGAMIVAPLMTPILGIVLGVVLADRRNLIRSVLLVIAGACAVVVIGFVIGLTISEPVVAATNSQVAARVSPRLIDLLAALATGAVGSIALVRSDISDTLPGVAIAISLVPPLAVVGLTLESHAYSQSRGALLLFLANVSAILASGIVVMAIYGAFEPNAKARGRRHRWRPSVVVIGILVIAVAIPLAATSVRIATTESQSSDISHIVTDWATAADWSLASLTQDADGYTVRVIGQGTPPDTAVLQDDLDQAGLGNVRVTVELIPEHRVVLGPTG
jgi:uncharacterized hydrophobic protein (TIGR00271 family)